MVSVLFNGFSAALLWVAQGEYFSLCVTSETKGFYYGIFWSIYQSSHIFGSLIGGIVLQKGLSLSWFNLIMAFFALAATISFLFIRKPFVPSGKLFESYHLAAESLYFTESVMG